MLLAVQQQDVASQGHWQSTRGVLLQLADRGGLPVLVELGASDDAWLRDLRAASMRSLALLSTADALKPRLADAGALPLLCTAGKSHPYAFQPPRAGKQAGLFPARC